MASIKVFLRTNKKKTDGTCPLVLNIINNRSSVQKFLGFNLKPADWDKKNSVVRKSHSNSVRLNFLIAKKISEANAILLDADNSEMNLTITQIKHKVKHNNKSSFFTVAEEHLSDLLKLKKFNQYRGEKPRINHFKDFIANEDICFQQITTPLLNKFMVYLKSEKNVGDRTVMNCLIVIRTVYNRAIKGGLVESKYYPFGVGKIQIKLPESRKIGLNESEIKLIESFDFSDDKSILNARNIWLVSFYLAGVRISDIIKLKWQDVDNGRLTYVMGKNNKVVSLKIPDKANAIIEKYRNSNSDSYVFPYLKDEYGNNVQIINSKIRSFNSTINKNLKRMAKELCINKKVSMHISRHSFGQIAGDKIAPQQLQKLYRHSDLKTTIGYQSNFIYKEVDGALSEVLNF